MKLTLSNRSKRILIATGLVVLGIAGRIAMADMPNIEPIMALTILAAAFLGGRYGMIVGVASILVSDLFIGMHAVMWSTWTAWAIIGASAFWLHRKSIKSSALKLTGASTVHGIVGVLFFYLWTNAGVWLEGTMYARTLEGLMASYVAGLPFLRLHVISTITIVPLTIATAALIRRTAAINTTAPQRT